MVTHAELHALLSERRSVRRFRPDSPPRDVIESLIESAITAPSASNKQPWRFVIVQRRELIDAMTAAVRSAVDATARAMDPAFAASFRTYGEYFTRFEHAPLTIVALFRPLPLLSHMLPAADAGVHTMERDSGLIGVAMAIENLLLAAHAAGLGASGMTGPLIAMPALRELLHVPPSWEIAALVPAGYPDETPQPTSRKAAEKVTEWIE